MFETWLIIWQTLWSTPLYRALLILIALELGAVGAMIGWMIIQSARQMRQARAKRRFLEALEDDFFSALAQPHSDELRGWMQRAQRSEEHTSELQSRPHLV